ncbi:MAG: hypothetical protein A2161_03300 [Candidatus Schekmanbacteria bacterium RBG_13_48_7]|uniref:PIN domain-containing protein n=1 Tax=Candidatus Schekmanbacteria bacterium RBG_13_48_7 TaxID=1817878 RepID=A0A1F7RWK1_9BACT|nr:MAG: hypothetical protein A2161_03300 [Candidatus Schekmanbacteria bacterium RBG_13_48_7]
MQVLVDSSVWIDYFRSGNKSSDLDYLIDENIIVINDIILCELIPVLQIQNQLRVIGSLMDVDKLPMNIVWAEIVQYQVKCIEYIGGGIGIPDLLIAQNAIQNRCVLYSLDKHLKQASKVLNVKLHA